MKYRIFSWNVNGLRANLRKGTFEHFIEDATPDILCIQETKAKQGQVEIDLPKYEEIWNSAMRPGYSGTAIFTKIKPLSTAANFLEDPEIPQDFAADTYGNPVSEGRVLTAEFPEFYLVTVYTPNSKPDLSRLRLRFEKWDPTFKDYLQFLEKKKPVVVCGDFNAAHTAIDLARPAENERSAGYTVEERQGITRLIDAGLIDTFRELHPDEQKYTWWTWRAGARIRNIGWRIDYFFISKSLKPHLKSADIYNEYEGSDHCPISITLDFNGEK